MFSAQAGSGTPMVSIVVPAFNQGVWLRSTLESVLLQSYRDWECIVVDDGSTDNTREIVRQVMVNDDRVRLICQPNSGVCAARNRGLESAVGRYVVFLDGDDLLLSFKLADEVSLIERHDADLCYAAVKAEWIRDPSHPMNGREWAFPELRLNPFQSLLRNWESEFILPIMGFTVRREFLINHKIRWNPELYSHEDWDFWLQVFWRRPRVVTCDLPSSIYRVHGESATSRRYLCWLGYLESWRLQGARYSSEPGAVEALELHRAKMFEGYKSSFPFRQWLIRSLVRREWFRSRCPWPLQAPILRFCGVKV